MEIRILQRSELLEALHLVWEVFAEDVADTYAPEGVEEFQKFIKYNNMRTMMDAEEVIFFGAFGENGLCGVIALKPMGHICLFFVKKDCQGKGIGRMLFQAAYHFCAKQLRVKRITVSSAPGAAAKYQHMGMRQTDGEQNVNGVRYIPMEMDISPADMPDFGQADGQPNKRSNTGLIIGCIAAAVLGFLLLVGGGTVLITNLYTMSRQAPESSGEKIEQWDDDDPMNPDSPLWDERDRYGDEEEEGTATPDISSGVASIPEYIADKLPYEIKEEDYTYTDNEKQSTLISFSVKYPVLQGLDNGAQDKVNAEIKKCAMATVEEIYNNPSQEFKEKILGTQNPVLASVVTYKVCYANERFASIVFEDMGARGSQEDAYQNLRTLNIGLADGKVYGLKDIVELSDAFTEEWLAVMREEAGDVNFLAELDEDDLKKTLGGESIDGNYVVNFFVDKDGIEIGYDLNYVSGDPADLKFVWVTAPFTFEGIKPYQKDQAFWDFFR